MVNEVKGWQVLGVLFNSGGKPQQEMAKARQGSLFLSTVDELQHRK